MGVVGEEVGVLETKEFSCSNLHLVGGDRVVRQRENQKAGNSRLRINARSSPEVICLCAPLSTDVRPLF